MADLPILLALLAAAAAAWLRPWVGVLGLVFVGLMNPQGYANDWLNGAPAYLAMGGVVALATARQFVAERRWPVLWWDWRFAVAALLAAQMVASTALGINPWVGWPKLADIAKSVPLLLLVLLLIDDRDKLRWLLATVALSISVVVLKGGVWALFMGFQERVYGPPGSQYYDNNEFAVATMVAVPLLVLWLRQAEDRAVRVVLGALVALGFVSALSSWSRGGLLCVAATALLLALHARRKWLALPLLLAGAVLLWWLLPEQWLARMQTLQAPVADGSAASRLEVWKLGWDYALEHPWFGGGLGGWIYLSQPTGDFRAWHSAYVGIAAEHGLVGLALWCALLFGTIAELSVCAWRHRALPWLTDQATMLRVSLVAYAVGSAFLSIAYWELLYLLLVAGMLIARLGRREAAQGAGR
jgi:putative inorganic carbon (hco3(-)) transporter